MGAGTVQKDAGMLDTERGWFLTWSVCSGIVGLIVVAGTASVAFSFGSAPGLTTAGSCSLWILEQIKVLSTHLLSDSEARCLWPSLTR